MTTPPDDPRADEGRPRVAWWDNFLLSFTIAVTVAALQWLVVGKPLGMGWFLFSFGASFVFYTIGDAIIVARAALTAARSHGGM